MQQNLLSDALESIVVFKTLLKNRYWWSPFVEGHWVLRLQILPLTNLQKMFLWKICQIFSAAFSKKICDRPFTSFQL